MVIVDANIVLRYILNDDEDLSEKAEDIIKSKNVRVTVEVIAEVVYVLKKVYLVDKESIREAIKGFLSDIDIEDNSILLCALDTYFEKNLDFVDCVLYAYKKVKGYDIATFDRKLNKLLSQLSH